MRIRQKGPGAYTEKLYRNGQTKITYQSARPPKTQPPKPTILTNVGRKVLEYMEDDVTPGYFKKLKRQEPLPVQRMYKESFYPSISEGDVAFYRCTKLNRGSGLAPAWYQQWDVATGVTLPQPTNISGWQTYLPERGPVVADAIADFREKLWDVGTFAAEFGKTVDLVGGAALRTRKRTEDILAIMKGRRRSGKPTALQLSEEFSSMWLEYRYGWRILYYDIESAQEAYEKLGQKIVLVRGSKRWQNDRNVTGGWTNLNNAARWRWNVDVQATTRAFCGGYLDYDKPVSVDPLVTAWELVPFSFVVDWFYNIGNNIQAYSPFATGDLEWCGVKESVKYTATLEWEMLPLTAGHELIEFTARVPSSIVLTEVSRRVPVEPSFDVGFKVRLNGFKVADIAAIALQTLARKTKVLRAMGRR